MDLKHLFGRKAKMQDGRYCAISNTVQVTSTGTFIQVMVLDDTIVRHPVTGWPKPEFIWENPERLMIEGA